MSVWNQDRIPGSGNRWALGVWLSRRKLASAAFVPGKGTRLKYRGGRPYFYVFDFPLAASDTQEARQSVPADFTVISVMCSNTVGGTQTNPGSRFQVLDSKTKKRFSIVGINDINIAGNPNGPFMLRKGYRFPAGGEILVRAQNLQAVANTVQFIIYGVQDQ